MPPVMPSMYSRIPGLYSLCKAAGGGPLRRLDGAGDARRIRRGQGDDPPEQHRDERRQPRAVAGSEFLAGHRPFDEPFEEGRDGRREKLQVVQLILLAVEDDADEEVEQVGLVGEDLAAALEDRVHLPRQRLLAGDRLAERAVDLGHGLVEDELEQGGLGGGVVVERHGGDADVGGDRPHAGAAVAVLRERGAGRSHHAQRGVRHRPVYEGARRSRNAATPSRWSSVRNSSCRDEDTQRPSSVQSGSSARRSPSLSLRTASGGLAAMRAASSCAAGTSWSWETTRLTRPMSRARPASRISPVKSSSAARSRPTRPARRPIPATSEHRPRRTKSSPNLACSDATRMSAMRASSIPQPTAAPFTAAITGTFVDSSASASGVSRGSERVTWLLPSTMTARTSSPEQNAGSAPVITRHRAAVPRTACSSSS